MTLEANQAVTRPKDHNPDLLPFQSLGGRRFEVLSYLYLLDDAPEDNSVVTLVKASGDKGRDVVVHSNGQLSKIVHREAEGQPASSGAACAPAAGRGRP